MWILIVLLSLAALAALLFLLYLLILVRPRKRAPNDPALLCAYAHRGLHGNGIPENSLAAFERACARGYGIELDVQLSRDGTVMVFHDDTLARMTGDTARVRERDAAELQALRLLDSEQTIPTFCEVLARVNGRVPILIELKGEDFDTSLCGAVAACLSDYTGAYCIESFNPLLLRAMQKQLPNAWYGLLYTNVCRDKKKRSVLNVALTAMALNAVARPDFIAYNEKDRATLPVKITTRLYRAARMVWTVRSEESLDTARARNESPIFEGIESMM
ncbi:MAG: glycerophosphodiester phosphodiesterase [Clostridia bacterium]|nr:glycerophosphodiester phosphodiesterase [Clostridia bacterium]MBQ9774288.1 glycerophosphodiester phosphodiesterase [Clostridia bacterium]